MPIAWVNSPGIRFLCFDPLHFPWNRQSINIVLSQFYSILATYFLTLSNSNKSRIQSRSHRVTQSGATFLSVLWCYTETSSFPHSTCNISSIFINTFMNTHVHPSPIYIQCRLKRANPFSSLIFEFQWGSKNSHRNKYVRCWYHFGQDWFLC